MSITPDDSVAHATRPAEGASGEPPGSARSSPGVRVILPEDSPELTPQAAVVLLRILLAAHDKQTRSETDGKEQK
ncbi:hypothetical protein [Spongiactinospora sp. TRM90649]|uniref:hypothetical protein n=1 Tax=Spongiactinospora sp. TRM90649 TaxID=3031114 RepID=UPI0023F731E5|nr:hypothetical protein [Spongiactinospora sp. TRM90649]MDF5759073.1 hypothetical protein [Spongiactinospora sp. TRM90649]